MTRPYPGKTFSVRSNDALEELKAGKIIGRAVNRSRHLATAFGPTCWLLFNQQFADDVLDDHGLDVYELLDSKFGQLPSNARHLYSAKR